MKKQFFIFFSVILISLFFSCSAEPEKADDEKKDENTVTPVTVIDPFSEILYKDMVLITGDTYNQRDTDGNNFEHTISNFSMAKYEVTYELWYRVYQWALANSYTFANAGREGNDGKIGAAPTAAKYEPVTFINWRDAMVWCNAYSEMVGFTPCYTDGGTVIKDSRDTNATACDGAVCGWSANGYRLPSEGEWQFTASNKGTTPWNYASGAAENISNAAETQKVAWYIVNSESSTKDVGTTTNSSALTLWDISGNVWEWCWDLYDSYPTTSQTSYRGPDIGAFRVGRGGFWDTSAISLPVGLRDYTSPEDKNNYTGFRLVRSN